MFILTELLSCSYNSNIRKINNAIYVNISSKLEVTVKPYKIKTDSITFLFPKTIPGIYSKLRTPPLDYFYALDSLNNHLPINVSVDSFAYTIYNASKLKTIRYKVKESEITTLSILADGIINKKNLLIINNQSVIGYFKEQQDSNYVLNIDNKNLQCVSVFNKKNQIFWFKNYQELISTPIIFTSNIDTLSLNIENVKIHLSTIAPYKTITSSTIKKILEPTIKAVFKEISFVKPKEYTFVFIFNDSINPKINHSALEHPKSSVYTFFSEPQLSNKKDSLKFVSKLQNIVSHELFHLFTPINFSDDDINKFDFQKLELSEHLWLYEGFVEYYSKYILMKNNILSDTLFLNDIAYKRMSYNRYEQAGFPLNLAKYSKEIYNKNRLSVFYTVGFMNALCFDIEIRESSKNKTTLFNILKSEFLKNKFFNSDSLFVTMDKYLQNNDISKYSEKYIYGNFYPDYKKYLSKIGVSYSKIKKKPVYSYPIKNISMTNRNTVKFSLKTPLTTSKEFEICSIDNKPLNSKSFSLIYHRKYENPKKILITILDSTNKKNEQHIQTIKISTPRVPYFDYLQFMDSLAKKQKIMKDKYFNKIIN